MKTEIQAEITKIEARMLKIAGTSYHFHGVLKDGNIEITVEEHFIYQDKGVKGNGKGSKSNPKTIDPSTPFKYGDKMPPPSAFASYTTSKSRQFAIAKSVQFYGIPTQDWLGKFQADASIKGYVRNILMIITRDAIIKNIKTNTNAKIVEL